MSDHRLTRETAEYAPKVKSWTELQIRRANRVLFHVLFQDSVVPAEPVGLARVMEYTSRGGILGEIGVVNKRPRTAACVAYAHPQLDREATAVELVRVPAEVVYEIEAASDKARIEIENLIASREKRSAGAAQAPVGMLATSHRVEELGLLQGRNLMLIDLDRCTRCGDCVQACIDTHNDGYSRLFLDGPRFGKYLIPSSCRKCRDPVCMIGCPVGSIQQGDEGEIRIRDWCIGCGLCANQCPYDSIQMHDAAILPSGAPGWRWTDDPNVGANVNWTQASFDESAWRNSSTPFALGIEMHLATQINGKVAKAGENSHRFYFRMRFRIELRRGDAADKYRLLITSQGSLLESYINGKTIELTQDAAQKKRGLYVCDLQGGDVRNGENILAISLVAPPQFGAIVLDARLDTLAPASDEVEEKLVTERAVVCDQCSSLSGGRHACVYACPHEAALRLDAWTDLPTS
jgi:Fe-S-cluster-containing hydrogenase component 2